MRLSRALLLIALLLLPCAVRACLHDCVADQRFYSTVRKMEGLSLFIYKDVARHDTICTGHLVREGEHFQEPVMPGQCDDILHKDAAGAEKGVNRIVTRDIRLGQYDALTDFAFNLGVGTLFKSSLLTLVNAGRDELVPDRFMQYIYANHIKFKGLEIRRCADVQLWLSRP